MQFINIKSIIGLVVLFVVGFAFVPSVQAGEDLQQPGLPAGCESIQAPAGHRVSYRVDAVGVQVYKWNGASWDFVAPVANLYPNNSYRGEVGFHYGGPTWESNSGSKVVARRLDGCSPDATAIPWLLLQTVSTDGYGIFRDVTYIQRVKTVGGLAPSTPGQTIGAEARVPYTTEYYFYRARIIDRNGNEY